MPTVISANEIGAFIDRLKGDIISVTLSTVRKQAEEILHDILQTEFPAGKSTAFYTSVGQMADCVDIKDVHSSGGGVGFTVYIDSTRLSMIQMPTGQLNVHMGVKGQDFTAGLPIALDEGSSGSKIYNHPAHHFMDKAAEQMNHRLIHTLASGLTARGYDCSIG